MTYKTITQEAPPEPALREENRYETFLRGMQRQWRLEKAREVIREADADYISTFTVEKGALGKVMELSCPASKAVAICGQSQAEPYFFSLRCTDKNGKEPSPATCLNFKIAFDAGTWPLCRAAYGALSQINSFHFPDGVFLNDGDRLELEVVGPDTDIEEVKVSMEVDMFTKKET